MNMAFTEWLPEEALRGGVIERTLETAVRRWGEHWFARRLPGALKQVQAAAALAAPEEDTDYKVFGNGICVCAPAAARLTLTEMILDRPLRPGSFKPADRALLERLAEGCLDDLCRALDEAVPDAGGATLSGAEISNPFAAARHYALSLGSSSSPVRVTLAEKAAVAIVRAGAPADREAVPLKPLGSALALQPVEVSALLGKCVLNLGDLAGLAPGDVLVLDRGVDDPLSLACEGAPTAALCAVEQDCDRLSLRLLQPLAGKK